MSFARNAGSMFGSMAADVIEGSRLVSTQFAIGAKSGYTQRAEQLRAARLAALSTGAAAVTVKPVAVKQNKVAVRTA